MVKREESRNFDVFFGVWKRKKRAENPSREQNSTKKKKGLPQVLRVPRAFYSPSTNFEAATNGPSRAISFKLPLIEFILTPLERS